MARYQAIPPHERYAMDAWIFWSEAMEHPDAAGWVRGVHVATIGLNRVAKHDYSREDMQAWLAENLTPEGWIVFLLHRWLPGC